MLYDNFGGLLVATVVVVAVVVIVSVVWTVGFVDFCRSSWRWEDELNKRLKKLRIAFIGPPLLLFVVVDPTGSAVTGSGPWAVWRDVSVTYASWVIWSVPPGTTGAGWEEVDDDVNTCLPLSKRVLVFSKKRIDKIFFF